MKFQIVNKKERLDLINNKELNLRIVSAKHLGIEHLLIESEDNKVIRAFVSKQEHDRIKHQNNTK